MTREDMGLVDLIERLKGLGVVHYKCEAFEVQFGMPSSFTQIQSEDPVTAEVFTDLQAEEQRVQPGIDKQLDLSSWSS